MDPVVERAIKNGLALLTASLRQEVDSLQVRAYLRGLKDMKAEVITEAADRLSVEIGRRFFPTVPDWIAKCADIIDEQRKVILERAKAIRDECLLCRDSPGWRNVAVDGVDRAVRCECFKRAKALLDTADQPLKRPALPAATEVANA